MTFIKYTFRGLVVLTAMVLLILAMGAFIQTFPWISIGIAAVFFCFILGAFISRETDPY